VFARFTTDARAAIGRIPRLTLAANRRQMTPADLAAALAAAPSGNTTGLWHAPDAQHLHAAHPAAVGAGPPASVGGTNPDLRFDPQARAVLEQSLHVALRERAGHIGTEHLLAALVRTGPPDVVAWLAGRGATAEAVDALLVRLHGGPGVERLPAKPSVLDRRFWRWATAREHGRRRMPHPLAAVAVLLTIAAVFVLCVWGP